MASSSPTNNDGWANTHDVGGRNAVQLVAKEEGGGPDSTAGDTKLKSHLPGLATLAKKCLQMYDVAVIIDIIEDLIFPLWKWSKEIQMELESDFKHLIKGIVLPLSFIPSLFKSNIYFF